MHRRAFLRTAGFVGLGGLAGCLDSRASTEDEFDVGMSTDAFKPATITVAVGEPVIWRNTSKQGHTVTAYEATLPEDGAFFASGGFESEAIARDAWMDGFGGRLDRGDTYRHVFETAGEYPYFCIPHERAGMTGTVVIE